MKHLARAVAPAVALAWLWTIGAAPASAQSLSSLATTPDPQALRAFALVQHRPFEKRPLVITISAKSTKERGTFDLTFRGWSDAREIGDGWIERRDWIQSMSARMTLRGKSGSAEYVWPEFVLSRVAYDERGHKREVQDFSAKTPAPTVSSTGSADVEKALQGISGGMLQRAAGWLSELVVNYADRQILVGTTFHPLTIDEYLDWGYAEILAPAIRGQTGRDATPEEAKRLLAAVKLETWDNQIRVRGMSRIGNEEVIDYSGQLSYESKVNGRDADLTSDCRYLIDPYTGLIRKSGQAGRVAFDSRDRSWTLDIVLTTDSPPPSGASSPSPPMVTANPPNSSEGSAAGGTQSAAIDPDPSASSSSELSIADIYDSALPAVVFIQAREVTGSGFLVLPTDIVTNHHVVVGNATVRVLLSDGRTFIAKVVKVDQPADLALLRLDRPAQVRPLSLRKTIPRVGEQVLIIGAPEGLRGTLTGGLVSQLRDRAGVSLLQTDAAMNHGNSGGPVLDRQGEVIGVVSFGLKDTEALGFAIAVEEIRRRLLAP